MAVQPEQAGSVISAIGSLSLAQLRYAGASEATAIHGELVIGLLPEWQFQRELDPATGYAELRISPRGAG